MDSPDTTIPTPRTDAFFAFDPQSRPAEFARQLERELSETQEKLEYVLNHIRRQNDKLGEISQALCPSPKL